MPPTPDSTRGRAAQQTQGRTSAAPAVPSARSASTDAESPTPLTADGTAPDLGSTALSESITSASTTSTSTTPASASTPRTTNLLRRYPMGLDLALALIAAGLLVPTGLTVLGDSPLAAGWRIALVAALVLLHLTPLVRRHSALTAYGMAGLGMLVLAAAPLLRTEGASVPAVFLPSSILYFVTLYWVAESVVGLLGRLVLASAIAGAGGVTIRLALSAGWVTDPQLAVGPWVVAAALAIGGITAAWALGRWRRTRLAWLAELQEKARRTEEERQREIAAATDRERARIAREMHDVISHSLAVVATQAEGGRMATADETARATLGTIGRTARSALGDMRAMLGLIRVEGAGREPAPSADDIGRLVEQCSTAGQQVRYAVQGAPGALSAAASLAAYRIAQESLTNALKHAPGRPVELCVTWADRSMMIEVTNPIGHTDGRDGTGAGLAGMRQRAEAVDGTATQRVIDGRWWVKATLPTKADG